MRIRVTFDLDIDGEMPISQLFDGFESAIEKHPHVTRAEVNDVAITVPRTPRTPPPVRPLGPMGVRHG